MLVLSAKNLIKHDPYYPEDGDLVWCVFDCDSNSNDDLQYLLHFIDQGAYLKDSNAVISKLDTDDRLKGYSKSKDYYDILKPLRQHAVRRAQMLIEKHKKAGQPLLRCDSNPHTSVVSLVLYLEERNT